MIIHFDVFYYDEPVPEEIAGLLIMAGSWEIYIFSMGQIMAVDFPGEVF